MNVPQNSELIISQIKRLVESDKRSEIRLNANGGNSILLVCSPDKEYLFIEKMKTLMPEDTYQLIDLNAILIAFIEENKGDLPEMFEFLKGSVGQIFKAPVGESTPDLFKKIIGRIEEIYMQKKIPVLYHTGALFGSGIDNIHIMESELVMKSKFPLIILYPGTQDGENLLFLNSRPSSKYRCMIIK
jgi:hypothetical protein